jgi:hypothetical protein
VRVARGFFKRPIRKENCLCRGNKDIQLVNTLTKIKNILNKVDELSIDPEKFAYLRLCSLFELGRVPQFSYSKHSDFKIKFLSLFEK